MSHSLVDMQIYNMSSKTKQRESLVIYIYFGFNHVSLCCYDVSMRIAVSSAHTLAHTHVHLYTHIHITDWGRHVTTCTFQRFAANFLGPIGFFTRFGKPEIENHLLWLRIDWFKVIIHLESTFSGNDSKQTPQFFVW